MRDREYERERPPGTYRIVLLGSSHEVGSGVKDDETFENLVEDRLNNTLPSPRFTRYEILNMAVGGYGVLRKIVRLEGDGFDFSPDAVFFFVNSGDRVFDLGDMSNRLRSNVKVPFEFLEEIVEKARADRRLEDVVIRNRLQPYIPEIFAGAFQRLKIEGAKRGTRIFVVYRPAAVDPAQLEPKRHVEVVRLAKEAGLEILDLSAAFNQVVDRNTLVLTPWDDHTNAMGHQLLADKLYQEFVLALSKEPESAAR